VATEETVSVGLDACARIRVAVSGARGRMGAMTCSAVAGDADLTLVAEVDPMFGPSAEMTGGAAGLPQRFASLLDAIQTSRPQVIVDFTTPSSVRENVIICVRERVPVVVGTTGLSAGDLAEIEREVEANDTPVLVAPNFAMGAVLMMQFARQAAHHLRACEIVELHHDGKLDAPSGTSRLTRLQIEESWHEAGIEREVPIHSVRLPGLVAHQEVIFGGVGETLTIRHDSLTRESFMPGVLLAVKRIRGLQGLVVGLENIL
jgi:4-hydroxy-tetrahydrodipicolinate reductase